MYVVNRFRSFFLLESEYLGSTSVPFQLEENIQSLKVANKT